MVPRRAQLLIVGIALFVIGCGSLKVPTGVKPRPNDWLHFAANIARTNVADHVVVPPLTSVWRYNTGAGFRNASALVVDNRVFVGNLQGELHAIDLGTGKRLGYISLGSAIMGTPVLSGDFLYVPLTRHRDGVVAYDIVRGAISWRARVGDIETAPILLENRLCVTTLQGKAICLRRLTGEVDWEFTLPTADRLVSIRSSPSSDGRLMYFGADDGVLYALDISTGAVMWTFSSKASIVSTPSVRDGRVYFGSTDQHFYAVDAARGELLWSRNFQSPLYGSQAVDDRHVVVGAADGTLHCLNAETGITHWTFSAKSVINSAPLISGDVVFIGSLDRHLYALDINSGQLLWHAELSGRIRITPVVSKGYLVVLLDDRNVELFRSESPPAL